MDGFCTYLAQAQQITFATSSCTDVDVVEEWWIGTALTTVGRHADRMLECLKQHVAVEVMGLDDLEVCHCHH
jgi:hypothetical protein